LPEIERIEATAQGECARVIIGPGGGRQFEPAGRELPDDRFEQRALQCPLGIYNEDGSFQEYRIYRKNPDLVLVGDRHHTVRPCFGFRTEETSLTADQASPLFECRVSSKGRNPREFRRDSRAWQASRNELV
jgi:hypothetical protein